MKLRSFVAVACLAIAARFAPAADVGSYNLPGRPPYLLAHYMPWYTTPTEFSTPAAAAAAKDMGWAHWRWVGGGPARHEPSVRRADGARDIGSVLYPLIGVYDSGSRAVIRYHLATMQAAGVSGITAIWYGPGSDTDRRIPLLLDEAGRLGMRVAITYEEKLNFPGYRSPKTRADLVTTAAADLTYICKTYADHPAYLHRDGLPVIAQFNGYSSDPILGTHMLRPEEWKQVFAALPRPVAYIRQNLDTAYHPTIAGAYIWWNQTDLPVRFAHHAAELRDTGRLGFFMNMVCPGFNDSGVWGWGAGARVSKGYGIDVLKVTEDNALIGQPELVQLVTWNDFNESTCFEPTVQHHFDFLEELGRWWSSTTHQPVNLADLQKPFEAYRRSCSPAERTEMPLPR